MDFFPILFTVHRRHNPYSYSFTSACDFFFINIQNRIRIFVSRCIFAMSSACMCYKYFSSSNIIIIMLAYYYRTTCAEWGVQCDCWWISGCAVDWKPRTNAAFEWDSPTGSSRGTDITFTCNNFICHRQFISNCIVY